jgi:hypothetical protein
MSVLLALDRLGGLARHDNLDLLAPLAGAG